MKSLHDILNVCNDIGTICMGNVERAYNGAVSALHFGISMNISPRSMMGDTFDTSYKRDEIVSTNITCSPRRKQIFPKKEKTSFSQPPILDQMCETGKSSVPSIIDSNDYDCYELSDWEDDEALKQEDTEFDCDEVDGKSIPLWARSENIYRQMSKQKLGEGDRIFKDMPKDCNLIQVFPKSTLPYYRRQKVALTKEK